MRNTQKEAETQAEGEAGSMQGARYGTRSWNSEIMPRAKGRHSTTEPPRRPHCVIFKKLLTWGSLGGSAVWRLPLAQGTILESQDQVPRQAPGMEPASPSACVSASLCVSHE